MAQTFGQLKTTLRNLIWPGGEAVNLVAAHDKAFIDALMDIQKWVPCAQQDNTSLVPHCATFYRCGITILDAPRGYIKEVSVIDKINPDTGKEDATAEDDFCTAITYKQIDWCHVERYMQMSRSAGCCLPIPFFFGLSGCNKALYPIPTDAGLPLGLAPLPLGYHYPQTSTDRTWGRSESGVWALDRGKIWIAPWIQSTETVVIKWDGLKREWTDADPIDSDPDLDRALQEYVRKEHMDKFDKDEAEFARASGAYADALAKLIHECREETRIRGCEPSHARWSSPTLTNLYYNEAQSARADCTAPLHGDSVTVTIPAGTVASSVSVADANSKAQAQAQSQADAQLVCVEVQTFANDEQTAVVACQGEQGAPAPEGNPVTVTIPAGTIHSLVSKADANQQAAAQAQQQASTQLAGHCIYWNREQSVTLVCSTNGAISVTETVAAHTISSTVSQGAADAAALLQAQNDANDALTAVCPAQGTLFWNTSQSASYSNLCRTNLLSPPCGISVTITVAANSVSSLISVADANAIAQQAAQAFAFQQWGMLCRQGACGSFGFAFPP